LYSDDACANLQRALTVVEREESGVEPRAKNNARRAIAKRMTYILNSRIQLIPRPRPFDRQ